jgi:nucleoid-associated protein YgaU
MATSRPRCLVVATGLTAALWGAAAVLAGAAAGQPAGSSDRTLVRVCLAGLALAAVWAWLQGMAGVVDAWRGAPAVASRGLRRLALAACGMALAGSLSAPAYAGPEPHNPAQLSGLPLPDRAEGPAGPGTHTVVVRTGDSLWVIAERDLGPRATDQRISDRWRAIYRHNRGVIGPDPDLIRPGQSFEITQEQT